MDDSNECPVCLENITTRGKFCINGHRYCNVCWDKLDNCPSCRSEKGANDFESDKILSILIVKCQLFKSLFTLLNLFTCDINLKFDKSGMVIKSIDNSRISLIVIKWLANKFYQYRCVNKLYVAISTYTFKHIIDNINDDTKIIHFYLELENRNILHINIDDFEYEYRLLDLDRQEITLPPTTFSISFNIPHKMFKSICCDKGGEGGEITIAYDGKKNVIFKVQQDSFTTKIRREISSSHSEIIHGVFTRIIFATFAETPLSSNILIHYKNDFPICLEYEVPFGHCKLLVSPNT